jgi:hypothetical protein
LAPATKKEEPALRSLKSCFVGGDVGSASIALFGMVEGPFSVAPSGCGCLVGSSMMTSAQSVSLVLGIC